MKFSRLPSSKVLQERMRSDAAEFKACLAAAPDGAFFRTLAATIREMPGRAAPVDFGLLARELAGLEQRVSDLEAERSVRL